MSTHIDYVIKVLMESKTNSNYVEINLPQDLLCRVVSEATELIMAQPMLLELTGPMNICGDIHGQYPDLLTIFSKCGLPPASNYLFLGDYVDRAHRSIECVMLLLCLKLKFPEKVFLLRGNHESASLNRVYGFFDECKRRYTVKLWRTFVDCFNCLPRAAIVDDKIFCTHGGISPSLSNFSEINDIHRPLDIPPQGLMCDLLWSDPVVSDTDWTPSARGVSFNFNEKMIKEFLEKFGLDLICRGHQVVEDGYEFHADRGLVTVFSAPNYCGEFDNAAAVMVVTDDLVCSFQIFRPEWHRNRPALSPADIGLEIVETDTDHSTRSI